MTQQQSDVLVRELHIAARPEIVFTFFIDHAKHVVLCGSRVLEDFVDLAQFKRLLLFIVPDADCELL